MLLRAFSTKEREDWNGFNESRVCGDPGMGHYSLKLSLCKQINSHRTCFVRGNSSEARKGYNHLFCWMTTRYFFCFFPFMVALIMSELYLKVTTHSLTVWIKPMRMKQDYCMFTMQVKIANSVLLADYCKQFQTFLLPIAKI